ncbi:aldo/keto reductase [Streptomyces sp. NPDC091217]|uniref:aldo/keto reductase n=1 Tax=Streptomyces sp. NPDC091217 TaxID=3365975 RepID=UPI00381E981F
MKQRTIGGRTVSAIGLGGMPMSIEGRPEARRSIATIHAALDAGVTFVDTADAYHRDAAEVGHNEELIAGALRAYGRGADDVLVATKGGHLRPGDGSWTVNGDPAHLKRAAKESAKRLGVEAIGLYQFHRPDPRVPYADSIGAIRDLLDEGVIRMAGISNATVDQIDEANQILGGRLDSVQNQFSPRFRSSLRELEHCAELGIAFLPWSPLGGIANAAELSAQQAAFREVADEVGVSVYRVTLAWQLALAPVVVPIPGASRPESIRDSAAATDVELTAEQMSRLSAA